MCEWMCVQIHKALYWFPLKCVNHFSRIYIWLMVNHVQVWKYRAGFSLRNNEHKNAFHVHHEYRRVYSERYWIDRGKILGVWRPWMASENPLINPGHGVWNMLEVGLGEGGVWKGRVTAHSAAEILESTAAHMAALGGYHNLDLNKSPGLFNHIRALKQTRIRREQRWLKDSLVTPALGLLVLWVLEAQHKISPLDS